MSHFSDIFISYSRKDTAFAAKLVERIETTGNEVWVDWEDIPVTAEWWKEIEAGIDASDVFIFIISPDSAESKVCRQEVDYAVQNNKRIIPVLYRDVEKELPLHPSVRAHNWLVFRDTDDFDQAFNKLIAAISTDLDYTRLHTRFLTRAREWEQRGKDDSFLLKGTELREAEVWREHFKEPQPTQLHLDYIHASVAQRQREEQEEQVRRLQDAAQAARDRIFYLLRRFLWGMLGGWIAIGVQTFAIFRSADLFSPQRIMLVNGIGVPFGIFIGLMALLTDELSRSFFGHLHWTARLLINAASGMVLGTMAWATYVYLSQRTTPVWDITILAGAGLMAGFVVNGAVKLRGWQAFLITFSMTYLPLYVFFQSYTNGNSLSILYYDNPDQIRTFGVMIVLGIALGGHMQALAHDARIGFAIIKRRFGFSNTIVKVKAG